MADVLDYQILGNDLQLVEIELDPGEGVRAEVGTMTYMEDGIEMQTGMGGDLFSGVQAGADRREFLHHHLPEQRQAQATGGLCCPVSRQDRALGPGSVQRAALVPEGFLPLRGPRHQHRVAFTKRMGAGFFGGEGFILQRLTGDGLVFVHAGGTVIEKDLAAGETLRVDTGCLVAFATTVDYDIKFVGGFKNALFGGEGLFLAKDDRPG